MLRRVLETVDNGSIRKDVYQERMLWGDEENDASGQYEYLLYWTESGKRKKLRKYRRVKG